MRMSRAWLTAYHREQPTDTAVPWWVWLRSLRLAWKGEDDGVHTAARRVAAAEEAARADRQGKTEKVAEARDRGARREGEGAAPRSRVPVSALRLQGAATRAGDEAGADCLARLPQGDGRRPDWRRLDRAADDPAVQVAAPGCAGLAARRHDADTLPDAGSERRAGRVPGRPVRR